MVILPVQLHEMRWIPGAESLLVIDLWAHAYYLKHQSDKAAYLRAIWTCVNWDVVNRRFAEARG
jgi:Fe-Mn family superoxide dismutase